MLAGDGAEGAASGGAMAAAALAFVGAVTEGVATGVAGVDDDTAEARTRSTDELLAPQVASASTPAATN